MKLALPLDQGTVTVGINTASGHILPVTAASSPSSLEIAVGGPVPTLVTTGFSSGDTVLGPFQVTASYSAPVSGVDSSNFVIATNPANGVTATAVITPSASAVATEWVLHVTVSGPNANGALVYVHMVNGMTNVTPPPASVVNSPLLVR